jgi:hypothetical protein
MSNPGVPARFGKAPVLAGTGVFLCSIAVLHSKYKKIRLDGQSIFSLLHYK